MMQEIALNWLHLKLEYRDIILKVVQFTKYESRRSVNSLYQFSTNAVKKLRIQDAILEHRVLLQI